MAKPFLAQVIQEVTIQIVTADGGSGKIVLDQTLGPGNDTVQVTTDLFSKGILLQNDALAFIRMRGGNGEWNLLNGNLALNTSQLLAFGSGNLRQNMVTVNNSVVLNPANANYNEFNNTSVGGLNVVSRVDLFPDGAGTTIQSVILDPGNPNPDGRQIWWQNIGATNLTFANLSGAGTVGGLILCPNGSDFVVRPGGGVSMMFDEPSNLWFVRAA
jgi:hypothetical protein